MPERAEREHPQVAHIVTGHFHETAGYDNRRAHGTSDWLLVATAGGGGRFGHTGGELTTEPGDLVLLRPGTPPTTTASPPQAGGSCSGPTSIPARTGRPGWPGPKSPPA